MVEMTAEKTYKRRLRSVLIHKPLQREYTLVVISLLIISALAIGFVIHTTIREAMMGGGYRFGKISPYEVMSDLSYDLILRVSMVLFVTILVICVFGIFFLHRIAGPVYRFRSILHRVSQGDIPQEFHLREGDYFSETADDLNHVLRILRERKQRVSEAQQQIDQVIRTQSGTSITPWLKELREFLERIA